MSFFKKKSTIMSMAIVLIVLVGAYMYVASQPTPEEILKKQGEKELEAKRKEFGKILTVLSGEHPVYLGIPSRRAEDMRIYKETYDCLVRYEGATFELKPSLAEKWEIQDGRIITFHLRKGVKFYPSGDPFNAECVKFSYDNCFFEGTFRPIDLFGGPKIIQYDKTEIIDDYTVTVHFKKAVPWLLDCLAYMSVGGIVNPKFVNAHGGPQKEMTQVDEYLIYHQDVTGPYIVEEFKPGDRVILKRNPTSWWGGGWTGEKAKYPERIVIREVPEEATRMMLIGRGDAEVITLSRVYLRELKRRIAEEKLPLVIDEEPGLGVQMIVFDHFNPPTDDVHIRRALSWSFNYDDFINKILDGAAYRMYSFPGKGFPGYDPTVPHYDFDLEKAKAELALADPAKRAMLEKGVKIHTAMTAIGREGLLMWKSDLAKIGVNLIIEEMSSAAYREIMRFGGARILDRGWSNDYPDMASSYQFLGRSYYQAVAYGTTPEWVDKILIDAAFEIDTNKRLKMYRQVEEWAYESCPYIKVFTSKGGGSYNVRGSWVKGYVSNPFATYIPFVYTLWKELPEEKRGTAASTFLSLIAAPTRREFLNQRQSRFEARARVLQ